MRSSPWSQAALTLTLAGLTAAWPGPTAADDNAQKVTEGKPAPAVDLPATQIGLVLPQSKAAHTLRLQDLKEKKNVVLYFFPKALTRG